ncbi:MAG: hypothetical protein QM710_14420 [Flavobacterium sp.]
MRRGIRHLEKIVKSINNDRLQIRLFKATHSITFVSWDDEINFSTTPPGKPNDVETFNTKTNTPLSKYFFNHFEDLWKHRETVSLNDYIYIALQTDKGKLYDKLYWGPDSPDHDLPVFLGWNDKSSMDVENIVKNGRDIQVIYDNEIQWAKLIKIEESEDLALFNFAKQQLKITKVINDDEFEFDFGIFRIEYKHQHRIMLKDSNHVSRYLNNRGFCFIPSNMFDVYLGRRIKIMLDGLYHFFEAFQEIYNDIILDNPNMQKVSDEPKRIVAVFNCKILKADISVTKSSAENELLNQIKNFPDLQSVKNYNTEAIESFLVSTIKTDIDHILGRQEQVKRDSKHIRMMRGDLKQFKVIVHLIQIKVDKTCPEAKPQLNESIENNAHYTVIHMAGKKNITGGISQIKTKDGIVEKYYNLTNPLDTIFLRNYIKIRKEKKYLSVTATDVNLSTSLNKGPAEGFRNLVALEFYDMKANQNP